MLSNQVLHKIIKDIERISGAQCSVWNMEGKCIAGVENTTAVMSREVQEVIEDVAWLTMKSVDKNVYFVVSDEGVPAQILALKDYKGDCQLVGEMAVSQLENLQQAYKEHLDKNRFIQNLLLDNLLLADIYNQAKRLHVESDTKRAVFLIEPKTSDDAMVMEMLRGIYAGDTKDFVTAVSEGSMILIKALEESEGYEALLKIAKTIVDMMETEAMVNVRVAYGTIVNELKDVSKSYKEAGMALDVGRIFYAERSVLAYNELGIGRLIYQLPVSLCEMYLQEVFEGKCVDQFDEETIAAVNKFFENNLNISETARQLYLHRNTLVYRLEKIQKMTGLDVRTFDDALTFKIAMMVSEHLKFLKQRE